MGRLGAFPEPGPPGEEMGKWSLKDKKDLPRSFEATLSVFQEVSRARVLLLGKRANHFKSSRFKCRSSPKITSVHAVR